LTLGSSLDGLNYFADNNPPPGQTFTTGSNPAGYTLTGIYLQTAGVNSEDTTEAQTYTLRLFSISGSTATLISTYVTDNTLGFPDGDWLKYSGMTNVLQPNTVYAYTHSRNSYGWDELGAVLGSLYTGGQACLIPIAGGTITFGSSGTLDATFDVSMVPNGFPAIQNVSISPANTAGNPVYVPTPVTLSVQAAGATPLHYDWQTDNGTGGASWTDIANSNTNSYALNTTSMTPATYEFQVIVTNVNNSATSSVVVLNLSAAAAPVIVADATINPTAVYTGSGVAMSATFNGSMPITYQWMFNNGSGAVPIEGATNTTYSIGSAQLTNTGSYYVTAANAVSPFTASSTPIGLLVGTLPQNNTVSAGMNDAGSSPPTPGTYDISQLITTVPTVVAGLNYYVNNNAPPGQTFTTLGVATKGYLLSSIYMQEELDTAGGNGTTNSTYTLGIYLVSGNNAALITSYSSTNQPIIIEGDWIQWTGLTNILATNSTYAFSIQKDTGTGWWGLGNDYGSGDLYAGGQAALLPAGGIGAIAFSTDTTVDAGFSVALSLVIPTPHIGTAKISGGNFVLSGSGGSSGSGYSVLSQTNLAQPLANWTVVGTGTFDGSGNFSFTNAVTPSMSKRFFRIRMP
jgi:hypothetical protein